MVLFVGNLSTSATHKDLLRLFTQYGTVQKAQIIFDERTGRSRGFAFVNMEELGDAKRAIEKLDNSTFLNNVIVVTDKGPRHPVRASFTPPKK